MKKPLSLSRRMLIVVAMLAVSVLALDIDLSSAANPYYIDSRCECNTAIGGNDRTCDTQTTQAECEKFRFCWWRDTTLQNVLSDYATGQVFQVYEVFSSPDCTVLMYRSWGGPNVTAIISGNTVLIVGPGGGRAQATMAKVAFNSYYSGFNDLYLWGVVLPHVYKEDSWGVEFWQSSCRTGSPHYAVMNISYETARQKMELVNKEQDKRQYYIYGSIMPWGADEFIGAGSMITYPPSMASFPPSSPCAYIPVETDITIGTVPVKLIPSSVEDAGLLVYLPTQKIMIVGNLGAFLPDVGSFAEPNIPVDKWLSTLNTMKMKAPNYLILGRGMYIAGQSAVNEALTDQYDALNYLRAETLKEINLYTSLDDIVQNVVLPSELANSPYTRQFTSTIPSIIRAIYHEYLGWFDGNVTNLESLGTLEQAQRLVDFGGGEKQVLSYVKDCMTEHTREGALQALKMTSALRQVYPSEEADDIYIQSLKMLAWTTPSAHLRNYYLTEAKRVRPGP